MDRQPRLAAFDAVMYGIEGDPVLRSVIIALLVSTASPTASWRSTGSSG